MVKWLAYTIRCNRFEETEHVRCLDFKVSIFLLLSSSVLSYFFGFTLKFLPWDCSCCLMLTVGEGIYQCLNHCNVCLWLPFPYLLLRGEERRYLEGPWLWPWRLEVNEYSLTTVNLYFEEVTDILSSRVFCLFWDAICLHRSAVWGHLLFILLVSWNVI